MFIKIVLLNIFLILIFSCNNLNSVNNNKDDLILIQGSWEIEGNKNRKLIFNKNKLIDIYYGDTTIYQFSIEYESCNVKYTTVKATFLKQISIENEGITCYEITGLNNFYLVYRLTDTGHLRKFVKIK